MKQNVNISGYIEGYYGKLITWKQRIRIIKKLSELNLSHYFYCPKEDIYHRIKWRENYPLIWETNFLKFLRFSKTNNIDVIVGISPGLDFNYKNKNDYKKLLNKSKKFLDYGINNVVLMFDDIIDNLKIDDLTLAKYHANLTNRLYNDLSEKLYVVPTIYADELISQLPKYLKEFLNSINNKINFFYCGKKVICCNKIDYESDFLKLIDKERIILWDNFYANDYCPRKFFIGSRPISKTCKKLMINLTGNIELDLVLLEIGYLNINNLDSLKNVLKRKNIPNKFNQVLKYFYSPDKQINLNKISKANLLKDIGALDHLLWIWKSPLARELFPYFMILKQNLNLLYKKDLKYIEKYFTIPEQHLLKGEKK